MIDLYHDGRCLHWQIPAKYLKGLPPLSDLTEVSVEITVDGITYAGTAYTTSAGLIGNGLLIRLSD